MSPAPNEAGHESPEGFRIQHSQLRNRLIVFVKAPRPGFVKTRLAESIGKEAACEAYRMLTESLFRNLDKVEDNELEIKFTPDDSRDEVRPWLRDGWTSSPQGAGNLGDRLQRALEEAFTDGCERVAVIGSDCPDVTAQDVASAWRDLDRNDVILGPANDGGYWLIALKRPNAKLFENIAWSTNRVLTQTIASGTGAGLVIKCLRMLTDIDTLDEWREWQAQQAE